MAHEVLFGLSKVRYLVKCCGVGPCESARFQCRARSSTVGVV